MANIYCALGVALIDFLTLKKSLSTKYGQLHGQSQLQLLKFQYVLDTLINTDDTETSKQTKNTDSSFSEIVESYEDERG